MGGGTEEGRRCRMALRCVKPCKRPLMLLSLFACFCCSYRNSNRYLRRKQLRRAMRRKPYVLEGLLGVPGCLISLNHHACAQTQLLPNSGSRAEVPPWWSLGVPGDPWESLRAHGGPWAPPEGPWGSLGSPPLGSMGSLGVPGVPPLLVPEEVSAPYFAFVVK